MRRRWERELWRARRRAFTRTGARPREFRIGFVPWAGEFSGQGRPRSMPAVWANRPLGL
jgi:hypothetical protein